MRQLCTASAWRIALNALWANTEIHIRLTKTKRNENENENENDNENDNDNDNGNDNGNEEGK